MTNREKLSGVFAPVVTPFEKDEIRYDWLANNLQRMNQSGITGYLALGSNGEFMSLGDDEQLKVLELFAAHKGSKTVMVGAARESVKETVRFISHISSMGFDFVSVLPPHYFAKNVTDAVIEKYYLEVADSSALPVLVYNAPGFAAGVNIKPAVVAKLARHKNIVGMKDSSPSGIVAFIAATRENPEFSILAGSADFFYTALIYGGVGGIISAANYLPHLTQELYDASVAHDTARGKELHFKLFNINNAVSGKHGVAGVKAAMNVVGFLGGEPRSPLIPLEPAQVEIIQKLFVSNKLI
ncbi:MAG TPA: dihydrodipicolinate synthase family protein [Candidatus Methylacidiphilales bacterium]